MFSSESRNKRLQHYDWWTKLFCSASKTWSYDNVRKVTISQGNYYTTGCLLDYPYFKEHYKMISTDLSKQKALDTDPKAI